MKKENQVKKKEDSEIEEQPSWFHYVIIVGVLAIILFGIYLVFEINDRNSTPDINQTANESDVYIYKYTQGNITYNIELNAPLADLEKYNFTIEPTKYDVLNTVNFKFSFDTYNGTDNGQVSLSAIKLRRFLDKIYFFNFDANKSFVKTDEITCENSTQSRRVVLFQPRSNESGVFIEDNGCFVVRSTQPNLMPFVIDDFMVTILES